MALDKQVDGNHYRNKAIQPVEFIFANNIPFIEGNIIKYITRYKEKGGQKDLLKCIHYIDLLVELMGHDFYNVITVEDYCKANNISAREAEVIEAICGWDDINELKRIRELIEDLIDENY